MHKMIAKDVFHFGNVTLAAGDKFDVDLPEDRKHLIDTGQAEDDPEAAKATEKKPDPAPKQTKVTGAAETKVGG